MNAVDLAISKEWWNVGMNILQLHGTLIEEGDSMHLSHETWEYQGKRYNRLSALGSEGFWLEHDQPRIDVWKYSKEDIEHALKKQREKVV